MDFQFLKAGQKWVILAPRRSKRPDIAHGPPGGGEPVCPFCPGRESEEEEVYRVPQIANGKWKMENHTLLAISYKPIDWSVRVLHNKFPFAPIHEVIIHSPDHHKNFGELPPKQVQLIFQTYRQRYNIHKDKGQVYIFHNRGEGGGESLPHPHSQLAVVPNDVEMDTPQLEETKGLETDCFSIFCPESSQWPDEVWIAPLKRGRVFGEITEEEITDLADILTKLAHILDLRHGNEFPFNFYIYPGGDWYLRIIPRLKTLGGFELGTGIYINTQDPKQTFVFIKEHFFEPDIEKIQGEHRAEYEKRV